MINLNGIVLSEFAIIILIVGGRIVRRYSCINILIISPHHFEEMLGTVKVISTWLIKLTLCQAKYIP